MKYLPFLLLYNFVCLSQTIDYGAYLQQSTPNSIIVCWKTDEPTNSRVLFGEDNYNTIVQEEVLSQYHQIKLSNLKPNTKYTYAVGTSTLILQKNAENYFITPKELTDSSPLRVWIIGDFGDSRTPYKERQAKVANQFLPYHQKAQTDVWLWLGDNAYEVGSEEEYKNTVFSVYHKNFSSNLPFWACPGNHEYYGNSAHQQTRQIPYLNIINAPIKGEVGGIPSGDELYYSFNYQNVHFISLDTYGAENGKRIYDEESPQKEWLIKDLKANTQKWTIVFFHHPPYTKRSHESDFEGELINIRKSLVPIFDEYKVDLALSGHSHIYERSYLMKNHLGFSNQFDVQTHVVQNTNARYDGTPNSCPIINKTEGTIYAVVGSSGRLDVNGQINVPHPSSVYSNITLGGSLFLEVEKNRLDAKWISEDGEVLDQFTLFKEVNKTQKIELEYGQSFTLTPSWKGDYVWNTGSTASSVNISPKVNTTFTVRDEKNCLKDTFEVVVKNTLSTTKEIPNWTVFPSPANENLILTPKQTLIGKLAQFKLVDSTGKVLLNFSRIIEPTSKITIAYLPSGIYSFYITWEDFIFVKKVIKN